MWYINSDLDLLRKAQAIEVMITAMITSITEPITVITIRAHSGNAEVAEPVNTK